MHSDGTFSVWLAVKAAALWYANYMPGRHPIDNFCLKLFDLKMITHRGRHHKNTPSHTHIHSCSVVLQCESEVFNWSLCTFWYRDESESYVCLFLVHVMCVCAEAASLADSFSLYAHLSVCLFLLFVSPMTPAGHLSHLFYLASSLHTHTYTFAHTQTHIHNFPEAHLPLRLSHSVSCSAQYLFLSLHFKKKIPFQVNSSKNEQFFTASGGSSRDVRMCCLCVFMHVCTNVL